MLFAPAKRSHGHHLAQDEVDRLYEMIGQGFSKSVLTQAFNLSSRSVERHVANHQSGRKPTASVLFWDERSAKSSIAKPNCIPSVSDKLMRGRA